ncbi:MAG: hypothetical protein AAFY22_07165 [Pseudomonadota bacterium]
MRFFIGAVAIAMGVFSFISTASIGPRFDYDSASRAERQEWLDKQANGIGKWSRFFMPSGGGPTQLRFNVDDVVGDASRREIEIKVAVGVPYGAEVRFGDTREATKKACGKYVRSNLYDNNVRLVISFNRKKGGYLMKNTLSPGRCDAMLQNA